MSAGKLKCLDNNCAIKKYVSCTNWTEKCVSENPGFFFENIIFYDEGDDEDKMVTITIMMKIVAMVVTMMDGDNYDDNYNDYDDDDDDNDDDDDIVDNEKNGEMEEGICVRGVGVVGGRCANSSRITWSLYEKETFRPNFNRQVEQDRFDIWNKMLCHTRNFDPLISS